MKIRLTVITVVFTLLSACAGKVRYVKEIKPEDLRENAVLVGSIVTPDDGIIDMLYVWHVETKEWFRVADQEQIPEDNEHYQVGMFAIVVPSGRYAYASVNYSGSVGMGGSSMTWANPQMLVDHEVKAGELIYVGRAFCDATRIGCNWSVSDESARDLPILERLNPRLPWKDVKIQQQ